MQRIFLRPEHIQGETARISGNDHLHLARVLRTKVGEQVILLDNQGHGWQATLTEIGKTETTARLDAPIELPPPPPVWITVAQALGKGDKFEQVIQHGTEVGAIAFKPLRTERTVVNIAEDKASERLLRWRQIAKSAAEQSGQGIRGDVSPIGIIEHLFQGTMREAPILMLHPDPASTHLKTVLNSIEKPTHLVLCVGPEGGWSPKEVALAQAANVKLVSLGPRILRTETAALVAVSQILYHYEQI